MSATIGLILVVWGISMLLRKVDAAIPLIVFGLLFIGIQLAMAQDHQGHRPQDLPIHKRFYNTWMMPDAPYTSCCHDEDCRPAEVKFKDGKVYARQEGDEGEFTLVPPNKIEEKRSSPDGRNHLCGRRYWHNSASGDFSVFCFIAGAGG